MLSLLVVDVRKLEEGSLEAENLTGLGGRAYLAFSGWC